MTPTRVKPTFSYVRMATAFAVAGSIVMRWWPRSSIRWRTTRLTASVPRPRPCTAGSRNRSIAAWRYFGSSSSQNWIRPTIAPSSTIVRRVDSGSSIAGKPSTGSPHQRATSGVE